MILIATMMSVTLPQGLAGVLNQGPHGFSEILYAVTSATANNGSAFAGITANTPYYNLLLGVCMGVGRLGVIIPCLAIAGSLATQKRVPPSSGTLSTDNGVFGILLLVTILLFAGLTFLPALCLGPIVEHCLMMRGVLL
jgi:K+-transporting ATPase ATPase A chain